MSPLNLRHFEFARTNKYKLVHFVKIDECVIVGRPLHYKSVIPTSDVINLKIPISFSIHALG